ncbi:unnamed protein product [Lactuca virosa]|uniref:Uncharacterized protein n=1 Tax=Lactuca virosa TaxID=75947 RepID=A0AAU9P879_9ASTR|nr:unnamed protein product [Lactuca virosa]
MWSSKWVDSRRHRDNPRVQVPTSTGSLFFVLLHLYIQVQGQIQTSFRFSCIRPPNIGTNFAPFNHQSMSYSRYKVIAD